MGMVSEFKEFISKGNVIDLAVGVIIGAAFGKIVTSLVDQVVMPPIGLLIGGIDFSDLKLVLKAAGDDPAKAPEVAIQYGAFINTAIQFLIVAFVIFLVVKAINSLRRKEAETPAAPAAPTTSEALLMEIRDALTVRQGMPKAAAAQTVATPKPTAAKPAAKATPKPAAKKAPAKKK